MPDVEMAVMGIVVQTGLAATTTLAGSVKSLRMTAQSMPRKWMEGRFGGSGGTMLRGQMMSKISSPAPNIVFRYQAASRLPVSVASLL